MSRPSARVTDALAAFEEHRRQRQNEPASLFDAIRPVDDPGPSATALADAAIRAVADHAGTVWMNKCIAVIAVVAHRLTTLTVDDVADEGVPACYDKRAVGAAMREAARRGLIRRTGEYQKSRRPERHSSPVMRWESLLCAERAAS